MIKQFANTITFFLMQENIIREDDMVIYRYGTEQILVNTMNFVIIGIFAIIFNIWIEAVFFFVGLIPMRMIAGGYHAKTPQKCNVLTFTVYAVDMILINMIKSNITYLMENTIYIIIIVIIFRFAPVDHKNRKLSELELIKARNKSRVLGVVIIGICAGASGMLGPGNVFSISTMMGVLTASISLVIGSIVRGGEKNEKIKGFP